MNVTQYVLSDSFSLTKVLRRVPYLSVSWAHNSQIQQGDHHYQLPGYQGTPEHIPRAITSTGRFQPYDSSGAIPIASPIRVPTNKQLQDVDETGPIIHNPGIGFNVDVARKWQNPASPSSISKEASEMANVSLPEAMDRHFDKPFIEATDGTSFTRSEYDPRSGWDAWEDCGQFQKEFAYVHLIFEAFAEFLTPRVSRTSITISELPVADALSLQRLEISSCPIPADEMTTPGLVMSPSTPRTALPHTPVTPINQAHNEVLFVHKLDREHGNDREYDPTSLFVGGLEVCGPEAWTVGKLHSLFARFDGLLDVKMVRPRESLETFPPFC